MPVMMSKEDARKDAEQTQKLEQVWSPWEQNQHLMEIFQCSNSLMESLSGEKSGAMQQRGATVMDKQRATESKQIEIQRMVLSMHQLLFFHYFPGADNLPANNHVQHPVLINYLTSI